MSDQTHSRRSFFKKGIYTLGLGQLLLSGCETKKSPPKKETGGGPADPCSDYSGLSETDIKIRTGLGYVKKSPVANTQCNNCNLWLPPAPHPEAAKACGGCLQFRGPVDPLGYCASWAPKI